MPVSPRDPNGACNRDVGRRVRSIHAMLVMVVEASGSGVALAQMARRLTEEETRPGHDRAGLQPLVPYQVQESRGCVVAANAARR